MAVPADAGHVAVARRADMSRPSAPDLNLVIHSDLGAVESEWRRFERNADCTAFQTFDWLSTWHRHIGQRDGVVPVIAVGSFADGATAFILPLAIDRNHAARRLCWFGQEQSDYNAPLLAPDFSRRVTADGFLAVWRELRERMQHHPQWRHDWIELEKMPQTVGAQLNPFTALDVTANASGAHLTRLGDSWETFYYAKRSSATRRRDRAKRKHMSEHGEVRFVTSAGGDDARRTLATLMDQKSRAFAHRGIPDMFARPGLREFFLDLATNAKLRGLLHISRIEVGSQWVAANLALVFGDCYYHVLASYDDDSTAIAHYGPGALHLRELLAYAIKRGLRRFDFTIGDEPYKLEWSDTYLKLYDYSSAATWRGWPASWSSTARRRLKRFIKQTPLTWRLVSVLRTALGTRSLPKEIRPQSARKIQNAAPATAPTACVMGDMDLLQPLVAAGIACAVVTRPGVPSLYSRFTAARLPWDDFSSDPDALLAALASFGEVQGANQDANQGERPVLFYQEDAQLLFVSRHRERLAQTFRFVIAEATLVENLVDKARFQVLADRHGLPVPAAQPFHPVAAEPEDIGLSFPLIVKPLTRLERWNAVFGRRKALEAKDAAALRTLWPQLLDAGVDLLAQELIAGGEAQIESYHCYVDRHGSVAGEFTGRKIRTYPVAYGHTTALEVTATADVQRLGRTVVERLGLTGVAKLDFKRDRTGKLHLLEINPRFTLWHHPAAVAGLNIPALVYADLTGQRRPASLRAKPGVRWCRAWTDYPAARAAGVPLTTWLSWVYGCEAKSALSWHDPMPFLRSSLHRLTARHDDKE